MQRKNLAYHTFLVRDLDFTTPCWSAISSLLHLNQFFFLGGARPPWPPSIRQCCLATSIVVFIEE